MFALKLSSNIFALSKISENIRPFRLHIVIYNGSAHHSTITIKVLLCEEPMLCDEITVKLAENSMTAVIGPNKKVI